MESIAIRPAEEGDIDALCRLYEEFHEFHARYLPDRLRSQAAPQDQDDSQLKGALRDIIAGSSAAIFIAQVSGAPAGLAEVYLRQDDEHNPLIVPHKYGYMQSLFVLERFRGQNLGRELVTAAQHWARGLGAVEMRLETWEFPHGPLLFYERLGYYTLKRTLVHKL